MVFESAEGMALAQRDGHDDGVAADKGLSEVAWLLEEFLRRKLLRLLETAMLTEQ